VIRFLLVENHRPIEIHRQLCKVYGNKVMSEGGVRQWCILFKNGRTNIHDEERSGRPTIVTDELVAKINEKIRENRRFTITEFLLEFPQISRSLLREIVTEKLGYHKFCARWVPKLVRRPQKTAHGSIADISRGLRERWRLTFRSCRNWGRDLGKTCDL